MTAISSTFLFLLALICVPNACAFECSIGFFNKTFVVSMETRELCNYTNYHATVFMVCVTLSAVFMLYSILSLIVGFRVVDAARAASVALVFLFLSVGFELCLALIAVIVYVVVSHSSIRACVLSWGRCVAPARCLLWVRFPVSHNVQVHVEPVVGVITPRHPLPDHPSAPALVPECARIYPVDECPICMETTVNGVLRITKCGHTFHADCIDRWYMKTCPTCRDQM